MSTPTGTRSLTVTMMMNCLAQAWCSAGCTRPTVGPEQTTQRQQPYGQLTKTVCQRAHHSGPRGRTAAQTASAWSSSAQHAIHPRCSQKSQPSSLSTAALTAAQPRTTAGLVCTRMSRGFCSFEGRFHGWALGGRTVSTYRHRSSTLQATSLESRWSSVTRVVKGRGCLRGGGVGRT